MKKVISIILTLCIVFGMFSLCAAAEEAPMKVLVTSDIHWRNVGSVNSEGFFRPRDSLGQMTSLTPLIVDRFFADAAASDADYVFISGDLTDSGSPADSRIFAGMLADFEAESGKQVYVIDGNHDVDMMDNVPEYASDHVLFRETYHQFGYDEALARTEKARAVSLGEHTFAPVPWNDFKGFPVGVDARKVVGKNIRPVSHGGSALKTGGQAGAGACDIPMEPFKKSLIALYEQITGEKA